jgi:hypothetical protein
MTTKFEISRDMGYIQFIKNKFYSFNFPTMAERAVTHNGTAS